MATYKKLFTVDEFMKKLYDVCDNYKTAYVLGATGDPLTNDLIKTKSKQIPSWYTSARIGVLTALAGKGYFGFDCSNLIKALMWGWTGKKLSNGRYVNYASNTVPDINADGMIKICTDVSSDMKNIEIGEAVWFKGHIGLYVGKVNGIDMVIDCTPSLNGVFLNKMSRQKWLKHGKLPWLDYSKKEHSPTTSTITKESSKDDIKWLQEKLNKAIDKYNLKDKTNKKITKLVVDGLWGNKTENCVVAYYMTVFKADSDGTKIWHKAIDDLNKL